MRSRRVTLKRTQHAVRMFCAWMPDSNLRRQGVDTQSRLDAVETDGYAFGGSSNSCQSARQRLRHGANQAFTHTLGETHGSAFHRTFDWLLKNTSHTAKDSLGEHLRSFGDPTLNGVSLLAVGPDGSLHRRRKFLVQTQTSQTRGGLTESLRERIENIDAGDYQERLSRDLARVGALDHAPKRALESVYALHEERLQAEVRVVNVDERHAD